MSVQEAVNLFVVDASDDTSVLLGLLNKRKITLLDLIKSLQLYITNTSVPIRARAFLLLSSVLKDLPRRLLYSRDIDVLIEFFKSKFDDDASILASVFRSLITLVQMDQYNKDNLDSLLNVFIEKYNPRSYSSNVRKLPLQLSMTVFPFCGDQWEQLFIKYFLVVSQNEKDPSNLLIIFQIINKITSNFNIDKNVNDLFDCLFKYYPISFKSSNDTQLYQVRSLKASLNESLASSDLFATELIPSLIDKFNSTASPAIKMDILDTISSISNAYSLETIDEHFISLWNTLKYPVLNFEIAQIIGQKSLLQYYLNSTNNDDVIFAKTLQTIEGLFKKCQSFDLLILVFDDLKKNLVEMNTKCLQSYLLLSFNSNSDITDSALNTLFTQNFDKIQTKKQSLVAVSYFSNLNSNHFFKYQNEIFVLLDSSLSVSKAESSLIALAIQSTIQFILIEGFLVDEQPLLIQKLSDLLLDESSDSLIKDTCIDALSKLSKFHQFENIILQEVMTPLLVKAENNIEYLDLIVKLTSAPSLVNSLTIRLINQIDANNVIDILNTLYLLLLNLDLETSLDSYVKFVPSFLKLIEEDQSNIELKLFFIGNIFRRLVISINENTITKLLETVDKLTLRLLIVEGLPKSYKPSFDVQDLLQSALDSLSSANELIKLIRHSSISNIANKYLSWNDGMKSTIGKTDNLETKVWLLRGLVLKNDPNAIQHVVALLLSPNEQLSIKKRKLVLRILFQSIDENSSGLNSPTLEIIYRKQEDNSLLLRANSKKAIANWTIRPVWKQRIFELTQSSGSINIEVLVLMLMELPEDIYSSKLDELTPKLITLLSNEDEQVLVAIFKIFIKILDNNETQLKPYVDSILEQSVQYLKDASISTALKLTIWDFINALTEFRPLNIISPHKDSIVKLCILGLDDESRSVRMKIVETRQNWETLGVAKAELDPHFGHDH